MKTYFYNQHRIETHRALELLSDYYTKVAQLHDKQLTIEIERLIRVMKSRFFQALIDIQEYYEVTLHNTTSKSNLFTKKNQISPNIWHCSKEVYHLSSSNFYNIYSTKNINTENESNWETTEIIISRKENGLGFSIAGGADNFHLPNDSRVYVTKIISGGAAAINGQLRINDMLLYVNNISLENVTHAAAVEALKQAGDDVKLIVQRKVPERNLYEIELQKGTGGFGFSIAGGIGNQHIPGDNGIYITKVTDGGVAHLDGRLKIGYKLAAIKNSFGYHDLENVTHEQAVEILKATKSNIILFIKKMDDSRKKKKFYLKNSLLENDISDDYTECDREKNDSEAHMIGDICKQQIRTIVLKKEKQGLGFNIVGGEDGESIFISFILEGGSAFNDGNLRRGDKILTVNGTDIRSVSHEEAARILKETGEVVELTVEYDEEGYNRFESKLGRFKDYQSQQSLSITSLMKTTQKKSMYVRSLFNYNPNNDDDLPSLGLPFQFGDILHVTNASDDEWWLATKIFPVNHETFGIIPACKRWERKQRTRDRSVKFQGQKAVTDRQLNFDKKKKNYSFSRKFPFMKNRDEKIDECLQQEPFMLCYTEDNVKQQDNGSKEILYRVELPYMEELTLVYLEKDTDDEENQQLCCEESILSYEKVEEANIGYARPIVILGALKDQINDDLITEFPEKFGSCVPHTTRPIRDQEFDGRDYHFIVSREKMEQDIQNHLFIEAGQYNENLYGTSITSVEEVAKKGKHCILDVSGNAIKRLYAAHLYPIAIFVKLKSLDSIMNINKNLTEEQAKKIYHRAVRVEQEFTEHFTDIVEGDTYEEIYRKIKEVIKKHSSHRIWIPCKYKNL